MYRHAALFRYCPPFPLFPSLLGRGKKRLSGGGSGGGSSGGSGKAVGKRRKGLSLSKGKDKNTSKNKSEGSMEANGPVHVSRENNAAGSGHEDMVGPENVSTGTGSVTIPGTVSGTDRGSVGGSYGPYSSGDDVSKEAAAAQLELSTSEGETAEEEGVMEEEDEDGEMGEGGTGGQAVEMGREREAVSGEDEGEIYQMMRLSSSRSAASKRRRLAIEEDGDGEDGQDKDDTVKEPMENVDSSFAAEEVCQIRPGAEVGVALCDGCSDHANDGRVLVAAAEGAAGAVVARVGLREMEIEGEAAEMEDVAAAAAPAPAPATSALAAEAASSSAAAPTPSLAAEPVAAAPLTPPIPTLKTAVEPTPLASPAAPTPTLAVKSVPYRFPSPAESEWQKGLGCLLEATCSLAESFSAADAIGGVSLGRGWAGAGPPSLQGGDHFITASGPPWARRDPRVVHG